MRVMNIFISTMNSYLGETKTKNHFSRFVLPNSVFFRVFTGNVATLNYNKINAKCHILFGIKTDCS